MQVQHTEIVKQIACDGCSYLITSRVTEGKPERMTTLSIPWKYEGEDSILEFHFHAPHARERDCFRYWAHSPSTMTRSLKEREWEEHEIDEFMATHLYRGTSLVGVENPKKTSAMR